MANFFDTEFPVCDASGKLLALHVRREFSELDRTTNKPKKSYLWRDLDGNYKTPDGFSPQDALYGIQDIRNATKVFVTEGITATEALRSLGFDSVATVCGSAGVPRESVLAYLIGKIVYLWPDNDDGGRMHMQKIADRLFSLGVDVKIVDWKESPPKGDAADLVAEHNGTSNAIVGGLMRNSETYVRPDDPNVPTLLTPNLLIGQYIGEANEIARARERGVPYKTSTGFTGFDKLVGGGFRKDLISLHARGGTGKSALLMQIAIQSEVPTLFVSVEMDTQELTRRLIGLTQNIPMHFLLNDNSDVNEEARQVTAAYKDAPNIYMIDASTRSVSVGVLREYLKQLQQKSRDGRIMMMVDSINEWAARLPDVEPGEIPDVLAHGVRGLRLLSNEFKMPVWFTAHRTISGHTQTIKEAPNAMAAGSMVLQHEPDWVLGLEKKKDDDWIPGKPSEMKLHLLKGRKGPAGFPLSFYFQGEVMRFSESG